MPEQNYEDKNLNSSHQYCKKITLGHYENFPVASFLVAKHLRKAIFSVYAFARVADDFADEHPDKVEAFRHLTNMRTLLNNPEAQDTDNEYNLIFPALYNTIKEFSIPIEYFNKLLDAFLYDIKHEIFNSYKNLTDYCKNSATPVGRTILSLYNLHKEPMLQYSDHITTALQLANFWQDISVDIKKNRIYIPQEIFEKWGIEKIDFTQNNKATPKRELINYLVKITNEMFEAGRPLLNFLPFRLKQEIKFTILGGKGILKKISQMGENVFYQRPSLSKWDWIKIIVGGA